METVNWQKLLQHFLLGPVEDATNFVRRFRGGPGMRTYVRERMALIVPFGLLILVTSIGCAAAMVLYLGGTRPVLVLLAILLMPFVLLGSLFVQAYVLAFWLESRALAKALHRRPASGPIRARLLKAGIDLGSMPPVPWAFAALFLVLPLVMLTSVVPGVAFTLIALMIAAPLAYARFDR